MSNGKVLACIDTSPILPAVCDYAAWARSRLQAPLMLLHVLEDVPALAENEHASSIGLGDREFLVRELAEVDEKRARLLREQGEFLLQTAAARMAGVAGLVERVQRHGGLVDTLNELSDDIRLLVIGRQGEGGSSLRPHVGSHLETVIRTLSRPILVVPGAFRVPGSVLLAYDAGPSTRKCVDMLISSPLLKGMPVHLLSVGAESSAARETLSAAEQRLRQAGFEVTSVLRSGDVEQTLLDYADTHNIDLLVMGAYGHSRIRQFFVGSTTTNMLAKTTRPLLLLR
ncbi:universal stress protein [Pseudomonas sp. MYb185]|uniref:universal stress protein n=1 Tax=Pseudomonas sp. MYb185 TaxID=1848729 RepID=UPI000CFCF4C6|nr:universal stress protein [Pseudomonas sp. MYb185]PRB74525.1 universal stress protein UspA [Pseudomonas sp. MYb185]